jgi:hypothetical protein
MTRLSDDTERDDIINYDNARARNPRYNSTIESTIKVPFKHLRLRIPPFERSNLSPDIADLSLYACEIRYLILDPSANRFLIQAI